ncbi:MAG TPA: rhomboid family intramembrane serine protease [Blastocatellia bacterium]|nr:rhomboid family intramembrane serine protease [Blastocatellia bacterium]
MPLVEAADQTGEAARERHFIRALITRSSPLTFFILGTNAALFVLMWMSGGMGLVTPDMKVLEGFGAKYNPLIDEQGQYWRFVTSMFLHIGFIHFLLNNYALWIIGQEIERLYSSSRMGLLYLLSGIAGSVASYFYRPEAISAGASGAIFGLFGVMAAFGLRYRKEIPAIIRRDIMTRVVPLIVINLALGFSIRLIDNSAHIGGLVTGFVLALIIPYQRPHDMVSAGVWRGVLAVCLAVVLFSFIQTFRHYDGPAPRLANLAISPGSQTIDYWTSMRDGAESLEEADDSLVEALKGSSQNIDVSKAMEQVEQGIRRVSEAPRMDDEAEAYRQRLLGLLTEQKSLIESSGQGGRATDRREIAARREELIKRGNQFFEDYSGWIEGFLKKHGYELRRE